MERSTSSPGTFEHSNKHCATNVDTKDINPSGTGPSLPKIHLVAFISMILKRPCLVMVYEPHNNAALPGASSPMPAGDGCGCVTSAPFKNITVNPGPGGPTLAVPEVHPIGNGSGCDYNPRYMRGLTSMTLFLNTNHTNMDSLQTYARRPRGPLLAFTDHTPLAILHIKASQLVISSRAWVIRCFGCIIRFGRT